MYRADTCGTIQRSSSISTAYRISASGILLYGKARPSSLSTTAPSPTASEAINPGPRKASSTCDGYAVVFIMKLEDTTRFKPLTLQFFEKRVLQFVQPFPGHGRNFVQLIIIFLAPSRKLLNLLLIGHIHFGGDDDLGLLGKIGI